MPPCVYCAFCKIRIVVWKTRNVVAGDELTDMSDLYAKLWMDGCEPQKTDTHLRCGGVPVFIV